MEKVTLVEVTCVEYSAKFFGRIILNRVLSEEEIQELYNLDLN